MAKMNRTQKKEFRKLNRLADDILNRVNHKPIMVLFNLNDKFDRKIRHEYDGLYSIATANDFADLLRIINILQIKLVIWGIDSHDYDWFYQIRRLRNLCPELCIFLHSHKNTHTKMIENSRSVDAIYQDIKAKFACNVNHDIKTGNVCRYSLLFDQLNGEIVNNNQLDGIPAAKICKHKNILPLCAISNKLGNFRKDDNRRICPFHQDINPKSKPKKYNIGCYASYRCGYYDYAALNPVQAIPAETEIIPKIGKTFKPIPIFTRALVAPLS